MRNQITFTFLLFFIFYFSKSALGLSALSNDTLYFDAKNPIANISHNYDPKTKNLIIDISVKVSKIKNEGLNTEWKNLNEHLKLIKITGLIELENGTTKPFAGKINSYSNKEGKYFSLPKINEGTTEEIQISNPSNMSLTETKWKKLTNAKISYEIDGETNSFTTPEIEIFAPCVQPKPITKPTLKIGITENPSFNEDGELRIKFSETNNQGFEIQKGLKIQNSKNVEVGELTENVYSLNGSKEIIILIKPEYRKFLQEGEKFKIFCKIGRLGMKETIVDFSREVKLYEKTILKIISFINHENKQVKVKDPFIVPINTHNEYSFTIQANKKILDGNIINITSYPENKNFIITKSIENHNCLVTIKNLNIVKDDVRKIYFNIEFNGKKESILILDKNARTSLSNFEVNVSEKNQVSVSFNLPEWVKNQKLTFQVKPKTGVKINYDIGNPTSIKNGYARYNIKLDQKDFINFIAQIKKDTLKKMDANLLIGINTKIIDSIKISFINYELLNHKLDELNKEASKKKKNRDIDEIKVLVKDILEFASDVSKTEDTKTPINNIEVEKEAKDIEKEGVKKALEFTTKKVLPVLVKAAPYLIPLL